MDVDWMFWLQGAFLAAVIIAVSLGLAVVVLVLDDLWRERRERRAAARRALWSPDR